MHIRPLVAPLGFEPDYGALVVGVPGFEPGRSKERSALQAGAANRIRLTPKLKTLAESLGIEPSRARALGTLAMCWLTTCLALRKSRTMQLVAVILNATEPGPRCALDVAPG